MVREVLEHNKRLAAAEIAYRNALSGALCRYEELVLAHLTEAEHCCRRTGRVLYASPALNDYAAVCNGIGNGDGLSGINGKLLCRNVRISVCYPLFGVPIAVMRGERGTEIMLSVIGMSQSSSFMASDVSFLSFSGRFSLRNSIG